MLQSWPKGFWTLPLFHMFLYRISIHTHKDARNKIPPPPPQPPSSPPWTKLRSSTPNTVQGEGEGVNFNYIFFKKCPKRFDKDCRFVKGYYKNIKIYYKPSVNVVFYRTLCNYSSSFRIPIIRQNLKMKKYLWHQLMIGNRMLWNIINLSWLNKIGKLHCCLLRSCLLKNLACRMCRSKDYSPSEELYGDLIHPSC